MRIKIYGWRKGYLRDGWELWRKEESITMPVRHQAFVKAGGGWMNRWVLCWMASR